MPPTRFVVSGHATLDYVVRLETSFHGVGSAAARFGRAGGWSRPGGATFYSASRLADAGITVAPIAWLGKDADGHRFVRACASRGIATAGLDLSVSRRTVRCLMVYQPNGQTGCMIDDGNTQVARMTAVQAEMIAAATHVVISAGPAAATSEVLRACDKAALVAWIVKDDPRAFPLDLSIQIAERADVIFCNADEMPFVRKALGAEAPGNHCIIETRGNRGVLLYDGGRTIEIAVQPIDANDTTGAGDSLAGEILAKTVSEGVSWEASAAAAVARVGKWLAER